MGTGLATEHSIRETCSRGDAERAATLALETYGREVLGFLIARLGEQTGNEVFSAFLEDFWKGLPGFGWHNTLRSWVYVLACRAIASHQRGVGSRSDARFETSAALSAVAERVRTETEIHLRTPVKNRFRELRARLADDEQTLLILRVDRNLSWRELASVMSDDGIAPALRGGAMSEHDAPQSAAELDQLAAQLPRRFELAKEKLRKLAEAGGLLPVHEDEA